jgi:penicillin amidase
VPRALLARLTAERAAWMRRMGDPRNGSNNWVVGGELAGGKALMANDPHLTLASPSIFWASHLTVEGDEALDVAGITFPGIPGVILGHNERVAWGATTVNHDVTDFYLEAIAPCPQGGGDCVAFQGGQVPLETWDETVRLGVLGVITEERTVTFERVPHHGPLLPTIVDGELAPRPPGPAISVRYTGHEVTFELAAFQGLWRATSVAEAKAAMAPFGFGGQNWVFADDQGSIGWTTQALVPWRTEGCFTFDPATGEGVAPWWVVPGDGSCEWDGWIDAAYLPQDVDPARGFIATANADPVGATFDGDPLNEPVLDGKRLYVGAREYDEGYRIGRITRRLEALAAADQPLTADDMASVQADTYSNLGAALTPAILAALDALAEEQATPGTHPDLAAFAAGLSQDRRDRLAAARALLAGWTFETPAALDAADDSRDGADSAATVVFNAWLVEAARRLLGDEAAVLGRGTGGWMTNVMIALLTAPETLRTGLATETGEPLLCDAMATAPIESCTLGVVAALDGGLAWGAGPEGPGGPPASWRWGDLHRVTLEPLIPSEALSIPPRAEADPRLVGGYPRAGDNHSVDASSPGADDFDFRYGHGPAMRHITTVGGGERPRTLLALPGGQVMDTASPHWRDLMDAYWSVNGYFELPWTTEQVIDAHESRWRFE